MIRNLSRWLVIAIIIIILSGMVLTLWTVQKEEKLLRTDLLTKTRFMQRSISTEHVKALTGSAADLVSHDYIVLKEQIFEVQSSDPLIRFIYILGQRPDGTIFFLVDSEPPESEEYSPPGQDYEEASAVLRSVFASGNEITEGPLTDRWGTWVSGLAPITDAKTGTVVAVIGIDIDAGDWNIQIIKASAPSIIAMLLLVFLLLIFFYVQQRNEQERNILAASEASIKESENRYRTVFESTGTAMVIVEEDNTISFANKEFFRLTGYSQEDIDSRKSWTEFIFKEDLEKMIVQHNIRRQKPEEALRQYEFRLVTKSGDIRTILLTIDILPGSQRSVGSLIDITEIRQTEAELEHYASEATRYAETLRQTNEKLNLLNRITRHDILNQLTAILGYLDMMKVKFPDPSFQDYIDKEIQAAQNIRTQIMFTKDYQDIGIRSPSWFNVRKIILSNAAALPLSDVTLNIYFDNLEVYADPLIDKVFYTLLENTLRHGKNVTTIEISCHTGIEGLVIIYTDNGEGIPTEYKEAIFQRKYFKHTGFGLFLSRSILGITGMTIRETGEPEKCARFEIIVPAGAFRFTVMNEK
jgi:PAS domain S-box-containing protein